MAAHLLVLYPHPEDPEKFGRAYREEHLPYAGPRLKGATGIVIRRVAAAQPSPWHLISDVSFATLASLQACAGSSGGRAALEHAASISSGDAPTVVMVVDDRGAP